jgi:MFS transporter, Spinster family, sphingosine-1-phosphate transporter
MRAGRQAWTCVALLWVVWLLNYLDRQVIFSVFPLLQTELKLSPMQLGLISSSFLWVYAAVGPFAGYFADRFGRKRMIVLSVAVWSAVTWATGQVRTLPQLLIARGLMGVSEACYLPAGLALIASWHPEKTRAKATGLHYSGGYLGMVLGGGLGGWMAARYGWRAMFLILGMAGIGYAVVLGLFLKDAPIAPRTKNIENVWAAMREVFRIPGYTTMFIVFAVLSIGNWVTYTWLPLYLYEQFHLTLGEAGFTATFYLQAGSFAGILLGGAFADRWIQNNRHARVLTQAGALLLAAPFLFLSGFTKSVAVLIAGMIVFGIGRGAYDANCMPALCQIAPERLRATGFGLFNLVGPLTGGVVATAAGALKHLIGIGGALEAAGVLLVISAVALGRLTLRQAPAGAC